ncbi:MAG: flagellar biosynthesis anti-sigma factor FlgM [Granulicella sp.]
MNTNGIGNLLQTSLQQTSATQKSATEASSAHAPRNAAAVSAGSDQTSLSSASTLLAQALTTSDVRMDKVASLQQAINSGSYHVSSSDVADKLLNSLLG